MFLPSLCYCRTPGQSVYWILFQVTHRAKAGECILTGVPAQDLGAFLPRRPPGRMRRAVFRDLEELILAIGAYIDRHNQDPKNFF